MHSLTSPMKYFGGASIVAIAVSSLVLSSCGRKSQVEEDLATLKLIGYDIDQDGLFDAIENDDLTVLKFFKEQKFDLLTTDLKGRTGLHVAAESGSMTALAYLIKNGAAVDAKDENKITPLMAAARAGVTVGSDGNTEVIRYLLDKGADAQVKDRQNKFGLIHALDGGSPQAIELLAAESRELLDTGLLYSADLNMHASIPVLIRYGASVYSRNSGKTSLMIAAERGNSEAVQVLIDEGANLYAVSDTGMLAKDFAEGDEDVMAILLAAENNENEADVLALDWSEEELEALVQKAMDRSPVVTVADGDIAANFVAPSSNNVFSTEKSLSDGEMTSDGIAKRASLDNVENISYRTGTPSAPSEKVTIKRIRGEKVPLDLTDGAEVTKQVTMTAYAEKSLPVKVKAVDEGRVEVYDLRSKMKVKNLNPVVVPGSKIGVTGLLVKQITKKVVNNKLTGGQDKELVTLIIEDEQSGQNRELYAGYESQAAEAVAVLKMAETGEHLIVERNDEFYDLKGTSYKVIDVNDKEVIIENIGTGQLSLLPLMGVKR